MASYEAADGLGLGMNSLLGFGSATPSGTMGLLGGYYDPKEMQRQKFKQFLLGAGIGMMTQPASRTPISFTDSVGAGFSNGLLAANQAEEDYRKNALLGYDLAQKQKQSAWTDKEHARQESQWASEDAASKARADYISGLPQDQRGLALAFPDEFAKNAFPKPQEPYTLGPGQTRYGRDNQPVAALPANPPAAPSGYTWQGTQLVPVPGGPADPASRRQTPTELKEKWSSEDELPQIDGTIQALQRARQINDKTFTGYTAGARGSLGTSGIPGVGYVIDQEAAKATSEWQKTMSMEAIQQMASSLKGATTDFELNKFVGILADPSTPPDIRKRTIDRMLTLAQRKRAISMQRIQQLGGNVPGIDDGAGNGDGSGEQWDFDEAGNPVRVR